MWRGKEGGWALGSDKNPSIFFAFVSTAGKLILPYCFSPFKQDYFHKSFKANAGFLKKKVTSVCIKLVHVLVEKSASITGRKEVVIEIVIWPVVRGGHRELERKKLLLICFLKHCDR